MAALRSGSPLCASASKRPACCWPDAGSDHISFDDPATTDRFSGLRASVYDGELRLAQMCADEGLVLDLDELRYVSHWVTPTGPTRRFDTRFFVAHAPDEQEPLHDGAETVESIWIRPADAFAQHAEDKFKMIFPTLVNLEPLRNVDTVDELLAWADNLGEIPEILPALRVNPDGTIATLMPDGDGYKEALANPPTPGSTP